MNQKRTLTYCLNQWVLRGGDSLHMANRRMLTGKKAQAEHGYCSLHFARTLWLFTVSDHKTFVFPQTAFGILGALSGHLLTTDAKPDLSAILFRIPHVLLWTWLNTLVFTIANQRLPGAVIEDLINKPWRPLASGRISITQARRLLLCAIPLSLVVIYLLLGAVEETVLLYCLTWMYNDCGGAEENFAIRNLIIAAAYVLYGNGALRVACAYNASTVIWQTYAWHMMIFGVIFFTMQMQDLKDQEGDRTRQRRTAPLILGDAVARYTIAIPTLVFSVACPVFWDINVFTTAGILPTGLSVVVAVRVLVLRSQSADRVTWRLWSYWLVTLYALPSMKNPRAFAGFFDWIGSLRI